jgi:anti-sigma factor ChrR (cupin superfamily)
MITEQQQEQASLYALGALTPEEQRAFEAELRGNLALRELAHGLQQAAELVARSVHQLAPPPELKSKLLARVAAMESARPLSAAAVAAGFRFATSEDQTGWKQLPIPGAWIKLLSLEKERGYAVLLGRLDPGVRYPAHVNVGPEDFYILTGDLVVGDRTLGAGDFHHADKDSHHDVNYSVGGCTLLAVLTTDDPLVAFATA